MSKVGGLDIRRQPDENDADYTKRTGLNPPTESKYPFKVDQNERDMIAGFMYSVFMGASEVFLSRQDGVITILVDGTVTKVDCSTIEESFKGSDLDGLLELMKAGAPQEEVINTFIKTQKQPGPFSGYKTHFGIVGKGEAFLCGEQDAHLVTDDEDLVTCGNCLRIIEGEKDRYT